MSLLWLDGEVRFTNFQPFDLRDRGLLLGDGVFDTMLVVNHTPLWKDEHEKRMRTAAHALGILFDQSKLDTAISAVLERVTLPDNELRNPMLHVLRLTLTRGVAQRGLATEGTTPSLLATLEPFDQGLIGSEVRLRTSKIRRNPTSPTAHHKTLSYLDNILAAREAAAQSADDALLLNTHGHVCCASTANVFLVEGEKLITAPLSDGVLPGIVRDVILREAKSLGLKAEERNIEPVELLAADSVFLTNSLRLIRPVTELDGKSLGDGDTVALLALLKEKIHQQTGANLAIA